MKEPFKFKCFKGVFFFFFFFFVKIFLCNCNTFVNDDQACEISENDLFMIPTRIILFH